MYIGAHPSSSRVAVGLIGKYAPQPRLCFSVSHAYNLLSLLMYLPGQYLGNHATARRALHHVMAGLVFVGFANATISSAVAANACRITPNILPSISQACDRLVALGAATGNAGRGLLWEGKQ